DTLLHKSYDDLNTLFYQWLPKDTLTAKTIVNAYIEKAKGEKDSIEAANGYYYYATSFGAKRGLQYADTIIKLTQNSKDKFYPAVGYLLKGYWYYYLDDYKKTMEYYLIGYNYAVERDNIKMLVDIQPRIAFLKSRIGDYKGAVEMNKNYLHAIENQPIYREEYSYSPNHGNKYESMHLSAISDLAYNYLHLKELDSSQKYFKYGIHKSLEYKNSASYYRMVCNSGKLEFYKGNFQDALDSLDKAIPYIKEKYNIALAQYYRGKSFQALGRNEKATSVFLKTDSLITKISAVIPEFRDAYEYLTAYYNDRQERDSQLIYIDKLLELDSVLLEERVIGGEIARKYDTPELLRQKETIIRNLENRHKKN
ncbi:hypothetical protein ED312_23520, partial [Sinomicrobium pectinilyticum]